MTAQETALAVDHGRVTTDGTVLVTTPDGEKVVGQYPEGSAEEALAFFTKRYDALAFEVGLLEQRVRNGALSPEEATDSIGRVSAQISEPRSVGDLVSLAARLDALRPLLGVQKVERREDRARQRTEAREAKQRVVDQAEAVAAGTDWRGGVERLRQLLAEWKQLPRLDKRSDDELWHRFSGARSTFSRRRKAHFSELDEQREGARVVKERLVREAEALQTSTEWGPTSTKYRDLMQRWKAAGGAPRSVEDALWQRFRGAQDVFFAARDAANAEIDKEFAANAEVKLALLVEAEALLPVTHDNLDAVRRSFRDIGSRWDDAGKVPRDQVKTLEGRMRTVEQAIRRVDEETWRRSDPEKSARAGDLLAQLETAVARLESDLDAARSGGDAKKAASLESDLASRRQFLGMARRTASDFSA